MNFYLEWKGCFEAGTGQWLVTKMANIVARDKIVTAGEPAGSSLVKKMLSQLTGKTLISITKLLTVKR